MSKERVLVSSNEPNGAWEQFDSQKEADKFSIKSEANRRILVIAPEWKQRNMISLAVLLLDKRAKGEYGAEEEAQEAQLNAVWAQITLIRQKSDALEDMEVLPQDWRDDKWWTP